MIKLSIFQIISFLMIPFLLSAQSTPTSYQDAKKMGDEKYRVLQMINAPEVIHYFVLKTGKELDQLMKNENTVYVVDKTYDLNGRTISVPNKSVVVFRNGTIRNGTLFGEETKYCLVNNSGIDCHLSGDWERIAPVCLASELGLRPGLGAKDHNYSQLRAIVKKGLNVFLDGSYYISFPEALVLNYHLHLFGGQMFFSKHAFDFADGGGIYANGVHFCSIDGNKTDDIVCGSRKKHSAIMTGSIIFKNCHFSCNRVVSLLFEYANPAKRLFGVKSLEVRNCYADDTGKFLVMDAPIIEKTIFANNTFIGFEHPPIYITPNHSKRSHPKETNTNPWAEEVVDTCSDIYIDSNIFIGKEVSLPSYYCSALVVSKRCFFLNNYLKDIVNYSDKYSSGDTVYDTYLSCVDVVYENNYVENMMSYSKDKAKKPTTEIGKSKVNPLSSFDVKASRYYVNNVFICDGKQYIAKGADEESLTSSIFLNVSPIDAYVWNNNSVIYKDIVLDGRSWSSKYGSFQMHNCYFECAKIKGNLVFSNSEYDLTAIDIRDNSFKIGECSTLTVFNQLYENDYQSFSHGTIRIEGNNYVNATPIYHYFVADYVSINSNLVDNAILEKNVYLNDYSGEKTPVFVRKMDSELILDTEGQSNGAAHQVFSSSSSGIFFVHVKDIPKSGLYYSYLVGSDHAFKIVLYQGEEAHSIDFRIKNNKASYSFNGQQGSIGFGDTKSFVWKFGGGLKMRCSFEKGNPNRIVISLLGHSQSSVKLGYIGE